MPVVDHILSLLDIHAGKRAEAERAEAQQAKVEMEGLGDHPGWKRLTEHLTTARNLLHSRYDEGEELSPQERAFLNLSRRLLDGPQFLLDDAQAIVEQTNR